MGIQITTGISSGIDYEEIIKATLDVERVSIDKLEAEKKDYDTTISAYGTIKSSLTNLEKALAELGDADSFFEYSGTSSHSDILTMETGKGAAPGTYHVEVKEIAKPEILMTHDGFTDAGRAVGTGTLAITVGGQDPIEIEIDEEHNSLAGIARAINDADAGVTASIVETNSGLFALTLTGKTFGQDIQFSVTQDGDGNTGDETGLSRLYTDPGQSAVLTVQEGTQARLSFGNKEIVRSSNQVEDLIPGVTLNLETAREGTQVTLQVKKSDAGLTEKVQEFVDAFNAVMDNFALFQNKGDEESVGTLFGDGTISRLKAGLQQSIFMQIDTGVSGLTTLSDLGIEVQKAELQDTGYLTFSAAKFQEKLESNEDDVVRFFTVKDTGLSDRFTEYIDGYTDFEGILDVKTKGYQSSITRIDEKIEEEERKLTLTEERLRTHYASLETTLGELQNTQSAVDALINAMNSSN